MSERNVPSSASPAAAERSVAPPAGSSTVGLVNGTPSPAASVTAPGAVPGAEGAAAAVSSPSGDAPTVHPTAPVTTRPAVRPRRPDPLTRMGPWGPVASAAFGVLLGALVVVLVGRTAEGFEERLSLVFVVLGLGLLGAGGALLADEVRILRRRGEVVRGSWVEATAGALNGLTPARLLLLVAAFILFLAAYVLPN